MTESDEEFRLCKKIKIWEEQWNLPQMFYGFCIPDGYTIKHVEEKYNARGYGSSINIKDMWGKTLKSSYKFTMNDQKPYFATCSNKECGVCAKDRKQWLRLRSQRFTWLCIALLRSKDLGAKLPKDMIKYIAEFIE